VTASKSESIGNTAVPCHIVYTNEKTHKIIAFIDWEDAFFGDFSYLFKNEKRSPAREFMAQVQIEYEKIYNGKK
jgi:hypothetical protein